MADLGLADLRRRASPRSRNRVLHALREVGLNDWIVIGYLCVLNLVLLPAQPGPERTSNLLRFSGMLVGYASIVFWVRAAGHERAPWLRAFVYRGAQFGALLGTYLLFRDFLPVANPHSLDLELYQLDLAWFGVEPAMWMDGRGSHALTEWFAFFYYSYFFIVASHILLVLYLNRDNAKVARFGLGMTLVASIAHTLYIVVPGYGPFRALADHFQHPLQGGFFWEIVLETVHAGGAQKDIFPSLHTGFPSFIALFAFHHRREQPFRYTWFVLAFFALNIIGATMYLRWHYLIDVIAGLLLAISAHFASVWLVQFESRTRRERGLSQVWPPWSR